MTTYSIRGMVGILSVFLFSGSLALAIVPPAGIPTVVSGNTAFAFDLYSILKKEKGNVFFSPYSISSALAMTYGGARGETAAEMAKALHLTLEPQKTPPAFAELNRALADIQKKGNVQLDIANSLWVQKDYRILPEYLSLTKHYYGAPVMSVDYRHAAEEARKTINGWVEDRTRRKITDLIRRGDLDPQTVMVLVNAIYFKGKWETPFNPKQTARADFSLLSGGKIQVAMMYQKGRFGYKAINGGQLLELPYAGKKLSMVLLLPDRAGGLAGLENELTPATVNGWLSGLPKEEISVGLPKFKVTWGTFELNKPLQALGMRRAFGKADFSGIDGTKDLAIALVLHKAFVDVNEEGTEAAAAAGVITRLTATRTRLFMADHPFLFFIRDNSTGSILFFGRMINPNTP